MYDQKNPQSELYLIFVLKEIFRKLNKTYQIFDLFSDSRKEFLTYIKNVKENIIIIEDNGNLIEQLKLLQDLFDTMDLPFAQIILLSTEEKNSLNNYVQIFNEPCNFKQIEL